MAAAASTLTSTTIPTSRKPLSNMPPASFYFFTVGRLKTIDDIKHMVLALPRSATCVVLQAATGQPRAIKRYSDFTLATVGDLNDLPMIMGVLA